MGEVKAPSRLAAFFRQEADRKSAAAARDEAGNELLRRAALVRWFDEEIYREALTKDVEGAPHFKAFIRRPEVGVASERDGTYMIRDSVRDQQLDRWRFDSVQLRNFSWGLMRFFERRKSPIDAFTHRIFADPTKALQEFKQLYEQADRAFDLAQCDTLLRILRNRGDQRGPDLTKALNDREQYFWSRSLFADDWIRTAHFLKRPRVTKRFKEFLAGRGKWIFRLYASGGAGKTAYLRWLIARYCVPERGKKRRRIPVARVDLDFVHVPAVAAAPWLLLIPLAEQLNVQLPLAPFLSFLISWQPFSPALQRPVSRASAGPVPSFDETRENEAIAAFAASLADDEAVLVLDTLEEVILHHGESLQKLLVILSKIRAKCAGLKLVLSGRYDPFVREGATKEVLALRRQSETLQLQPWGRKECWDYLKRVRKLRAAMPFEAFQRPGGGNPFKLSLFADLVGKERPFTRADVRELRRVEVEYLVERVIERIPESECPLRWLLRYAVVPRQLTEDFVAAVLAKHLQNAMTASGPDAPDLPAENLPAGAEIVRKRRPWTKCAKPFETSVEWPALLRYAGSASWIKVEDGAPRLRLELVSPMRYLLQEQPVFWDIQKDAVGYFEKLAGMKDHDWGEMMCEAVYHQFQLLGSAAEQYWLDCLKKKEAQNAEVRRQLAECLLSGDFLDDRRQPLPHKKTGTILSLHTLAEATLELAALDVRESMQAEGAQEEESLRDRAVKRLAKVRALEAKGGFQIASSGRRAMVEAVAAGPDTAQALAILEEALARGEDVAYRPPLLFMKGNLLTRRGDAAGAEQAFEQAADCAKDQETRLIPVWRIQATLGHAAFERDDLERAAERYGAALEEREKIPDADLRGLIETVTEIDRSSANWSRAQTRLDELDKAMGRKLADTRAALLSQLVLDVFAPSITVTFLDARLNGLAAALLGNFRSASDRLEEAWKSNVSRDPGAATQARFEQIRVLLRDVRDYNRARSLLGNLRDLGDLRVNGEMLLVELQVRTGQREQAEEGWRRLRAAIDTFGPRRRAMILATGLALELEPRTGFDNLLEVLAAVRPATARLPLLRPFQQFEGTAPVTNGVSRRFQEVFPVPDKTQPDFVLRALLLAEVLRYLGDRNSAAGMLKDALEHEDAKHVFLRRQVINALLRLEAVLDDGELFAYAEQVRDVERQAPEFTAIARLELAEWWIKRGEFELAGNPLVRSPQAGSQYAMRYRIARSRVEQKAEHAERANDLLADARQIAQQLGIPFEMKLEGAKPPSELFAPEHRLEMWTPRPQLLDVTFRPAGGSPMRGQYNLELLSLFQAVAGTDPSGMAQALGDRKAAAKLLSDLVPIQLEQRVKLGKNVDLRIDLGEGNVLAGLPWEWALRDPFRFVYRSILGRDAQRDLLQWFIARLRQLGAAPEGLSAADRQAPMEIERFEQKLGVLADGWHGRETKRNLNAKLGQTVAAIVKLSTEKERSLNVGSGSAAISIEFMYARHGIKPMVYDPRQLNADAIPKFFRNVKVLHICLPVTELSGLLQLGTGGGTFGNGLSASFLDALGGEGPRPIVILDPPMPSRDQFWAQQVVWRNLYARQLFERQSVDAVIGMGLSWDGGGYLEDLLGAMQRHDAVGEVVKLLSGRYAQSAAVLYAFDPEIPLP